MSVSKKNLQVANQLRFRKSFLNPAHSFFAQKGFNSEKKVIADLHSQHWEMQFQRLVTPIAEIDLIFQRGNEIRLIEVKTLDNPWRSFERISQKQIQKLKMNRLYFYSLFRNRFQFVSHLAWVTQEKIEYVEIN